MTNKILNEIIATRHGHYCHAIEVNYVYELEAIIESLINEMNPRNETIYTDTDFIEFFESIELYYLGEDKEEEEKIFNFNFSEYIKDTI